MKNSILIILNFLLISNSFSATNNELFINWKADSLGGFSFSPVDCLQEDRKLKPRCNKNDIEKRVDIDTLHSSRRKIIKVKNANELTNALNQARGGEVIILTNNIKNLQYYRENQRAIVNKHNADALKLGKLKLPELKKYKQRVYLIGRLANGKAPSISNATFSHISNILISHIKISVNSIKGSKHAWQILNSKEIRLTNMLFSGPTRPLAANNYRDAPRVTINGLLVSESRNIVIDRCMFRNFFHAVQFRSIDGFLALANKADHISSDMFSGGGLIHASFDSNLSLTKYPFGNIHSDMIQLSTNFVENKKKFKVATVNKKITIRNNVALQGSSPIKHKDFKGWQCFFTRDELGDKSKSNIRYFSEINIYNNICVSTQHHGVTLSRGQNNNISNNLIIKLDPRNQGTQKITASINVFQNSKLSLKRNISARVQLDNQSFYNSDRTQNISKELCYREYNASKGRCDSAPLSSNYLSYLHQQQKALENFLLKGARKRNHLYIERDFSESLRNVNGVDFNYFGYVPNNN